MAPRLLPWMARIAFVSVCVSVLAWAVAGWMHSNEIRSVFLTARPALEGYPLTVHSNEAGRVVVDRTSESELDGVWGLESEDAYAQMSTIVRIEETLVERGIEMLDGELVAGDMVRINADAFTGDPKSAYGLGFEEPRTPSDVGPHPTWFIDGRRTTWIVFVHGRGDDRLTESLRILPSLVEQGFPVLAVTYRDDIGAAPSPSGLRLWGLEEWRDLEAALSLAQRKGAKDFVIIGSGFGASIVSMFLHDASDISGVRGVIFDSPVLNLEGVVTRWAHESDVLSVVAWLGRRFAAVRFALEWDLLNQIQRSEQFDVQILMMFGAEDPVTPTNEFVQFAELLPDLVQVERFEQGGHTNLWNIDAERYEGAVADFLLEVVGAE